MKTFHLILATALFTGSLHAEFRTWTRNDGKTAYMELVGKTGQGDALKGSFKMRNRQTAVVAASDLIAADAERLKTWRPNGKASVFDSALDGNLVKLEGDSFKPYDIQKSPTKYYLFYYTASWCGPCHRFTPSLVKFYDKYKPLSDAFEIILVTDDSEVKAMEGYAKQMKMNWPQVKLSKADDFKKQFKHPGRGIPNLVLTDLDGKLLKTSYEGENYVGPTVVMEYLETLIK